MGLSLPFHPYPVTPQILIITSSFIACVYAEATGDLPEDLNCPAVNHGKANVWRKPCPASKICRRGRRKCLFIVRAWYHLLLPWVRTARSVITFGCGFWVYPVMWCYDKWWDNHTWHILFIKSMRAGSNPWICCLIHRVLYAGEDVEISLWLNIDPASEDIENADPRGPAV